MPNDTRGFANYITAPDGRPDDDVRRAVLSETDERPTANDRRLNLTI